MLKIHELMMKNLFFAYVSRIFDSTLVFNFYQMHSVNGHCFICEL